jgi:type II secretory pathway pseudopilin PulG
MKRLGIVFSIFAALAFAASTAAQNRSAELDKAYEEARAAYLALKDAEQRRDQGIEPQAGERLGTAAGGGSRPTDQYWGRQAQLEQEVELARKRYEAAQKRWNDLK